MFDEFQSLRHDVDLSTDSTMSFYLRIAYTRTFVMDGNFSTVHQNRDNVHWDIKLSHSEFFMTEPNWYKAHLAVVKEVKEVSCGTFISLLTHYKLETDLQ